jgi:hypothetical protein
MKKSPLLFPGIFTVAGVLGFVLFPHAPFIPGLLCCIGMIWLIYAIITGLRRQQ